MALAAPSARAAEPPPAPAAQPATPPPAPPPPAATTTPPAAPMGDEARARYDRGIELFTAKDYAGAIRELEAGHAIEPRREFLFAEAQALRLQGDCKRAVALYQQFLASDPTPVQVNATHIALSRCAQQLASEPTPPNKTSATPNIDTLPPPPPPASPPPPWYREPLGAALLGAGVIGLGVGTGFLIASSSAEDDAARATTYPEYKRSWDSAASRRDVAVVALVAGGALTGAALYRYLRAWQHEREHGNERAREPDAHATPKPALHAWLAPGPNGAAAGVGGRF